MEEIFIRLATPKEQNSNAARKKAYNSIPEMEGYYIAYKPYGTQGRGFYYIICKQNDNQ